MHWPLSPPWQEGIGHNAMRGRRAVIKHEQRYMGVGSLTDWHT